jgi:predicted ATPase/class 3 adenylate cyclase
VNPLNQTVTILFTDIENSTSLWEKHPEAMDRALAAHDAILKEAVTANEGRVVKSTGDGIYAVFASAFLAVEAVIAAQKALVAYPWEGISPPKVRMALHTGEAILRQGDFYGPAVNRAARLTSLAAGDQILLSGTTVALLRDGMPSDWTLADLGMHTLRGLARPEDVYQLVHPSLPSTFPPLPSKKDNPNNLPGVLTSFVGREKEVAEICDLLVDQNSRLLTLVGTGGVGKTRLSLQAADSILDYFSDGTYFVPLAQAREAAEVPSAIMEAIGLRALGSRSAVDQLKTHLEYARMLIILDNFEHIVEARSTVSDLLSATARLRILVTSRSPLNIYGEKIYHVMPLRLPESRAKMTYQELVQNPAVRLFVERAQASEGHFAVSEQDVESVVGICTRLDGLPLAIELAAAHVRILNPAEILKQLDEGIRILRGGPRDLPERQQNLKATIQWSHNLLRQEERVLFRRLAIFSGGCTLESAEAICAFRQMADTPDINILDGITRLIDQNLVFKSTVSGQSRYFMLETVRSFAWEELSGSGDEAGVGRNHVGYFLTLAENADVEMTGARHRFWLERLTQEHGNLRTALEIGIKNDPSTALRIASALRRFWHFRGNLREGLNWFSRALGQHAQYHQVEDAVLARALSEAGNLAWFLGLEESFELQERSVNLWRRLGDRKGLGYALWQLGKATWTVRGDLKLARRHIQESADILRDVGDNKGLANALLWAGFLGLEDDDAVQAHADLSESKELAADTNFMNVHAAAISGLGRIDFSQGNYASAYKNLGQSLSIFRELGDLIGVQITAGSFGALLHVIGDYPRAESCYLESMEVERIVEGKESRRLNCRLGMAMCRQGKLSEARQILNRVQETQFSGDDSPELHRYIVALAMLECASGRSSLAAQLLGYLDRCLGIFGETLEKVFVIELDRVTEELRDKLSEESLSANWKRGRELSGNLHALVSRQST